MQLENKPCYSEVIKQVIELTKMANEIARISTKILLSNEENSNPYLLHSILDKKLNEIKTINLNLTNNPVNSNPHER